MGCNRMLVDIRCAAQAGCTTSFFIGSQAGINAGEQSSVRRRGWGRDTGAETRDAVRHGMVRHIGPDEGSLKRSAEQGWLGWLDGRWHCMMARTLLRTQ